LSIRPEYVEKIMSGTKRFELRRVIFASTVRTVVVYASAPIQKVVGEFTIRTVHAEAPKELWHTVMEEAGIDERRFTAYFEGCDVGHAIEIDSFIPYPEPLPIGDFAERPPQNFMYLQ